MGFSEGEVSKPSDKYVGGKGTRGVGFYSGPCTPPDTMPHHYTFVLIASDFEPGEPPPGLTRDEVIAKVAPNDGSGARQRRCRSSWLVCQSVAALANSIHPSASALLPITKIKQDLSLKSLRYRFVNLRATQSAACGAYFFSTAVHRSRNPNEPR